MTSKTTQNSWIEVWVDSASKGEYVLILQSNKNGVLSIIDPQDARKVVSTFNNYEDAVHWLNEDEYDLIEGRWGFED